MAQSFPLTPMEVMFAEVMALKAYSGGRGFLVSGHDRGDVERQSAKGRSRVFDGESSKYVPTWYKRPWSEKMVICLS